VGLSAEARRAIATIRECIETDRYSLTVHFSERMQQRSLFWPDVQAVIDDPEDVRSQGTDEYNRPKWIVSGEAADGNGVHVVCAIDADDDGTEFITIFWEDSQWE
jgi:hypothetical protein